MAFRAASISAFFLLIFLSVSLPAAAQSVPQNTPSPLPPVTAPKTSPLLPQKPPTAAEIMRERISKAKAYIAVRNYNAAVYELENIRRETGDQSVQAVTNVLLTNSYLEQGDYKKAQEFLKLAFDQLKTNKPGAAELYNSVAGQVIRDARNKVERYKALGLTVSDRNLPLEAVNDIEQMRNTVEAVITQAKELGADKAKASAAMALLEEASTSRAALARDDYDARRWKDEVADSREQIAQSRSVIVNAVDGSTSPASVRQTAPPVTIASNVPAASSPAPTASSVPAKIPRTAMETSAVTPPRPAPQPVQSAPVAVTTNEPRPAPVQQQPAPNVAAAVPQQAPATVASNPPAPVQTTAPAAAAAASSGPMDVGSLISFATKQTWPVYPQMARSMRAQGVVRVDIVVDEEGQVAEVQNLSGNNLLQPVVKDVIRKWRFRPFLRDGQPVKAVGFVNFNFSL